MNIRFGRVVVAAIAAEILGVAILAILVAIFGPPGFKAAQPFAERLGAWVGPISGFVLCIAGGYWVAKATKASKLANGLAMGVAGALLDVVSGLGLGGSISMLFMLSNVGRIVGGAMGGWLAARRAAS